MAKPIKRPVRQVSTARRTDIAPVKRSTNIIRERGKIRFKTKTRKDEYSVEFEELPEADWKRIAASSPLPPNARFDIAVAICLYRDRVATSRTSPKTKRLVEQMRGHIARLLKGAAKLDKDPVFFKAGLLWALSRTGPVPADIQELVQSIQIFDQILEDGQDRMKMKRGRKPLRPLEDFIQHLVSIQAEATKRFVQRSIKNGLESRPTNAFISLCARVADPTIPPSRIEYILARCIKQHRNNLKMHGLDVVTGQYFY